MRQAFKLTKGISELSQRTGELLLTKVQTVNSIKNQINGTHCGKLACTKADGGTSIKVKWSALSHIRRAMLVFRISSSWSIVKALGFTSLPYS